MVTWYSRGGAYRTGRRPKAVASSEYSTGGTSEVAPHGDAAPVQLEALVLVKAAADRRPSLAQLEGVGLPAASAVVQGDAAAVEDEGLVDVDGAFEVAAVRWHHSAR